VFLLQNPFQKFMISPQTSQFDESSDECIFKLAISSFLQQRQLIIWPNKIITFLNELTLSVNAKWVVYISRHNNQ
jgi:hypothetical protein